MIEEARLTLVNARPEQLARRAWRWQPSLGQFTLGSFKTASLQRSRRRRQ